MCAPNVIETVRRTVSRRELLGTISAATLGAACGGSAPGESSTAVSPEPQSRRFDQIFDLTHVLTMSIPVYPSLTKPQMHQTASLEENGVYNNDLVFGEHTGTHIDAPMHFAEGGLTTDQLPAERFFAPLVVLSIAARASGNPFYVTVLESLATQIAFGMTLSRSLTLQGAPDRQAKVEAEHRPGRGPA